MMILKSESLHDGWRIRKSHMAKGFSRKMMKNDEMGRGEGRLTFKIDIMRVDDDERISVELLILPP
jgi:hypothetical protein